MNSSSDDFFRTFSPLIPDGELTSLASEPGPVLEINPNFIAHAGGSSNPGSSLANQINACDDELNERLAQLPQAQLQNVSMGIQQSQETEPLPSGYLFLSRPAPLNQALVSDSSHNGGPQVPAPFFSNSDKGREQSKMMDETLPLSKKLSSEDLVKLETKMTIPDCNFDAFKAAQSTIQTKEMLPTNLADNSQQCQPSLEMESSATHAPKHHYGTRSKAKTNGSTRGILNDLSICAKRALDELASDAQSNKKPKRPKTEQRALAITHPKPREEQQNNRKTYANSRPRIGGKFVSKKDYDAVVAANSRMAP